MAVSAVRRAPTKYAVQDSNSERSPALMASVGVPELERMVPTGGHRGAAVGRKGQRAHVSRMACEGADHLAGRGVEEDDLLAIVREHRAAVRRERCGTN